MSAHGPEGDGPAELPRLATVREVAGAWGVSCWAIYRWHDLGLLAGVRLGRRLLFERAALARFVSARRTGGDVVDIATAAAARGGR